MKSDVVRRSILTLYIFKAIISIKYVISPRITPICYLILPLCDNVELLPGVVGGESHILE
jgi:hypothetical protein